MDDSGGLIGAVIAMVVGGVDGEETTVIDVGGVDGWRNRSWSCSSSLKLRL